MILKEDFKIQLKDVGKENYIRNIGILEILENLGAHHSDLVGYGLEDMDKTKLGWILLDWKLEVFKRPKYGEILKGNTWGRKTIKVRNAYTYRDFEIYDEQNNLCIIATSKWAMINTDTGKIEKLTNEILEKYHLEEKSVFNIDELDKIKIPTEYKNELQYKVTRRDIDFNGHMHNLNYLYLAYEVLPENVYKQRPFDNVRIQYKKEIKYGDIVECKYTFEEGEHIVVISKKDENIVNAIITLK